MNASDEKSPPRGLRPKWPRSAISALLMLSAGALGACADIRRATSLPPVNPESPVAGVVAAAALKSYARPSFQAVPPSPLNIAPADRVKTDVVDMVRCRRAYEVWVSAHPALVSGTGGFAATLRTKLDNSPADVPTPVEQAAAESDAATMRAYVEPPPAMHPGPAPTAAEAAAPVGGGASARPSRAAAPAAPAPAVAARVPAAAPAPAATPAPATVAIASPSIAPAYGDPVLAHCR